MIIALFNAKGGQSKTTTAVNLAAAIAAKGKRVLLVDGDAQASATLHLGITPDETGTAAMLLDKAPLADVTRPTHIKGLDLSPGSRALASVDLSLAAQSNRWDILATALNEHPYDSVIIDCPPSQGLIVVNALVACQWFIIPVVPAYLARSGILDALNFADEIRENIGKCGRLLGVLLSQVDIRKRGHRENAEGIRQEHNTFKNHIGTNVSLEMAPSRGLSVLEYAPSSRGALQYTLLAQEVMRKAKK